MIPLPNYWSAKGAEGKRASLRGFRERTATMLPCRYCGKMCVQTGLRKHEHACQSTQQPREPEGRCHCGEPIVRGARACWRHTWRDERMRELDEALGLNGWAG